MQKHTASHLNNSILHAAHNDPRAAQSWMAAICGPHDLHVGTPEKMRFLHQGKMLTAMSTVVGEIAYGTDVRISVSAGQLNSYSISLPIAGRQELSYASGLAQSDPQSGLVISPQLSQELNIGGDCHKLQVAINSESLHSVLEELLLRPPPQQVIFEPCMQAGDGSGKSWWRLVNYLMREQILETGLLSHPSWVRDIERALIKGLLLSQPNNYTQELQNPDISGQPHYLRRACAFIKDNIAEDLLLPVLSEVAGVSRATLYNAFRRYYDQSPTQYIKQQRLSGVRQALLQMPHKDNICTLAMSWGFSHMGRFSSDYRKAFGEAPSDTVKRRA